MQSNVFELRGLRVWVAGHNGMAGSALVRRLATEHCHVLEAARDRVDLRRQDQVEAWLAEMRPDVVLMAAGKVGGIVANDTLRAEFLYDNLAMTTNVVHGAHVYGVKKLIFLGSTCIYPRLAPQPLREEDLLTGPLEVTNEPYAIAKIAGVKMVEAYNAQYGCDFVSMMPTNLYGPGDNYKAGHSHVFAALLQRFHIAARDGEAEVVVWGTGTPMREFMHVDDLADACIYVLKHYSGPQFFNVGTGKDLSIEKLAHLIAKTTGFTGRIVFDRSKPDGTPRKLVDVSRLRALGWTHKIDLEEGVGLGYEAFLKSAAAREA